jgi:hypothetical protein
LRRFDLDPVDNADRRAEPDADPATNLNAKRGSDPHGRGRN